MYGGESMSHFKIHMWDGIYILAWASLDGIICNDEIFSLIFLSPNVICLCSNHDHKCFLQCFSSRSFKFWAPTFKSVIYFELVFVIEWGMGWGLYISIWKFHCFISVSWRNCCFSIELYWYLCRKSIGHIVLGLFLNSDYIPIPHCLDYLNLYSQSWNKSANFVLFFFFLTLLWLSCILCVFYINFILRLSFSARMPVRFWLRLLWLYYQFEEIW